MTEHETLLSATDGSERSFNDADSGVSTPTLQSEHQALPIEEARCSLLSDRSAAWVVHGKGLSLSTLAAAVLLHENKIRAKDLDLCVFHRCVVSSAKNTQIPFPKYPGRLPRTH